MTMIDSSVGIGRAGKMDVLWSDAWVISDNPLSHFFIRATFAFLGDVSLRPNCFIPIQSTGFM